MSKKLYINITAIVDRVAEITACSCRKRIEPLTVTRHKVAVFVGHEADCPEQDAYMGFETTPDMVREG